MKYVPALMLLSAGFAFPQGAFPQTQAEQKGKAIIDSAIEALGGQKFLTMQDRVESGNAYSFYREQISGLSIAKIYTRYVAVAPDQSGDVVGQVEREAFDKDESSAVLFTQKGGWEITWRGTRELPQDEIDRYRNTTLQNVLYILRQRLKEPGMIFESRGSDIFDNRPVDIVDITDSKNRVITVYFNQSTHLPVRQMYKSRNAATNDRDEEVTLFSRYQDAGGVQWPRQIRRERNGEKIYEIYSTSVSINQDLTDDLFSLPPPGADLTKLPRQKKK